MRVSLLFIFLALYSELGIAENNLKFDWKQKTVDVKASIVMGSRDISAVYTIELEPVENGFLVKQSDMRDFNVNGARVPEDQTHLMRSTFLATMSMPTILVDQNSDPIDLINFDKYLELLSEGVNDPAYEQALESESFIETLVAESITSWCYWVCEWSALKLMPGEEEKQEFLAGFLGIQIPSTQTAKRLSSSNEGISNLELKSVISSEDVLSAIVEKLPSLRSKNIAIAESLEKIESAQRVIKVQAQVYTDSLQPIYVSVSEFEEAVVNGEAKQKKIKRTFEFDWK